MVDRGRSAEEPTVEGVRRALSVLVGRGLDAVFSAKASALRELPVMRQKLAGATPEEELAAAREVLETAIAVVPDGQYQDLLRVVLELDPRFIGKTARERREGAGEHFRSGSRPVTSGTIRQYHEPKALDQLAKALVGLEATSADPPRRRRTQRVVQAGSTADFGDPDGARADRASVLEEFVPIGFSSGGSLDDRGTGLDPRARVIFGRKGSGKTLYLRRLSLAMAAEPSVYADAVTTIGPGTEQVVRIGQQFPPWLQAEKWRYLWRAAILRSTLTHIIGVRDLGAFLSPAEHDELHWMYRAMGGAELHSPRSAGVELSDLLSEHRRRDSLDDFLDNPVIDYAENFLGTAIKKLPPLYFFLDGLDDEFQHAPYHWLQCQRGLFLQTMQLCRDARLAGRLKFTVALRDVVYASVVRSEHATRYRNSPFVVDLRWTPELAGQFMEAKVARLGSGLRDKRSTGSVISGWLGREAIPDPQSGAQRPLVDYLIEHTRALPRDVVHLGNRLCEAVRTARSDEEPLTEQTIHDVVSEVARIIGLEQLAITATRIVSGLMVDVAASEGYADLYGTGTPYTDAVMGQLVAVLAPYTAKPHLSGDDLNEIDRSLGEQLGSERAVDVLWQNDLLGVESRDGKTRFRYETSDDEFFLPGGTRAFRFHPVLRSALTVS